MNECDEPRRHRARIVRFVRDRCGAASRPVILPRDADVAQPLEIANDLVQPRLGIGRLVQSGDNGLDELAREPRDALIFGLHARGGLQHQPRHVDREASASTSASSRLMRPRKDSLCHIACFPSRRVPRRRNVDRQLARLSN